MIELHMTCAYISMRLLNRSPPPFFTDSQPLTGLAVTSPILLDNVQCAGTEESLLDCPRSSEIGVHNCGLMEGAGVRCGGKYEFSIGVRRGSA